MSPGPLARILIVDDEVASMQALCDTLRHHGYETEGCTRGEEALRVLEASTCDLLLTDLMMPEMDGVSLLKRALKIDPQLVGILMTGMGTIETAVQAMQAGALDYVLKPIKLGAMLPILARAVGVRRLRMENMELRDTVAIHELSQAIAHTLDPNVLLDKIAEAALAQFEADEASVMLLTQDGQHLYVAAVRGEYRHELLGARVPIGDGIAGWVADHREPLAFHGTVKDSCLAPLYPRAEVQAALCMPMITRNKLIGVLNVNCTSRRQTFAMGQIKVVTIFTNAAAASLEAARLHDAQRKADARYREVLNMAADAIVSLDEECRIVIFNAAAERTFGWSALEAIGQSLDILVPERLVVAHRSHVESFEAGPRTAVPMQERKPFLARRKDGSEFPAEISISRAIESDHKAYTAIVRDVSQRMEHEARIARLTRLYAVLSGVNSAIVRIPNETELFSEVCRVAVEQGGFLAAWVGVMDAATQEMVIAAGAGPAITKGRERFTLAAAGSESLPTRAAREKTVVWDNNLLARPDIGYVRERAIAIGARSGAALPFVLDGTTAAVMALYSGVPDAVGDEELLLLREMAGDIAFALDHIAKTRQVDYLATHDQLTGLPNRSLFLDRLGQAVSAAKITPRKFALVLADIERFKHVNDTLGRQAGDNVLKQVANRYLKVVERRDSFARVGADVFAGIMTEFTQPAEVVRTFRQRRMSVMDEPFMVDGQALNLSARAGIAIYPDDGTDAEMLFRNAEAALRRAKAVREPVAFYTADLNARVAQQLILESKLRRALERNEFVLHYQPKVDLNTGAVAGLEALIRWQDPETGLVPPMQFINLLEETGLILDVGRWAMEEAVRMAATLRAKGLPPVSIAVNVSPIQLRQADFVHSVETALAAAGGVQHGLDLEITESVIMDDIEANVSKLDELRRMGIGISIDDFGTGYSSLAYIARLPVDVIKIDRAFIRNVNDDIDSRSIVQAIISLTHALRRKVVAEGVETEEQACLLRSLKCDQFQGYLFSKPLPGGEIAKLLATQRRA